MGRALAFDYIIVGAGSAGCVLANRLSEDRAISVCLIEAGGRDNSLSIQMPAGVASILPRPGKYNWGFRTRPQRHLNDRELYWPRGRGWGGSSSINAMLYVRGHARDYDRWRQSGLMGWGFDEVLPYFKRSEAYEGGETARHGRDGPLRVCRSAATAPPFTNFLMAGQQAGYPATDDFNGPQQEGVGPYHLTIGDGARCSASSAFLHPVLETRPNLTVRSEALVSRVVFRGGKVHGVEVVQKRGAAAETLQANEEVILCAGAVQSPQILMLSGIGPADDLRRHGITTITDAPGVGQNVQDHLDISVLHRTKHIRSAYSRTRGLKKLGVGLRYKWDKTGAGSENFLEAGGFLKTDASLELPDLQLHFVNAMMQDHGATKIRMDGFTLHACQLRPESRGSISLASDDPFAPPLIDPNYLATETDRTVMRQAVRVIREICAQPALAEICRAEFQPSSSISTDDEIDAFVREKAETIYHPVGSVHMGIHDDAPLDPALKVRGVEGLRVVDASVMPTLIGGNTNAPTMMIAEKAADMILGRPAAVPESLPETS